MPRIDEQLTEQFYRWELRGRGWMVYPEPVALEPPFRPFLGHFLPVSNMADEGRKHTPVSSFISRLQQTLAPPQPEPATLDLEAEPEPVFREAEEVEEIQLTLPVSRPASVLQVESFLRHVCRAGKPVALEILGDGKEIVPQFVAPPKTATRLRHALAADFPGVIGTPVRSALASAWENSEATFAIAELGLGKEFMLPLGKPDAPLLESVVTALDGLNDGELGLCQVLFETVSCPWQRSIFAAVADAEGDAFFLNRPELLQAAEDKIASPLFAVVIRLAASGRYAERCWEIITDMAAGFYALSQQRTNSLIPLRNDDYPAGDHEADLLARLSRRNGMLLNMKELAYFVTLPTAVISPRLRRDTAKTAPAPKRTEQRGGLLLGVNLHAGVRTEVRLTPEERVRHMHVIGASGTGKSTLLFNLIRQDVESGQGVAVLDPHGDLVDRVLGVIPPERIKDVVLIDPSDEAYSVGFNILAVHSDYEKTLLASDLVSVFRRLSTAWGDQMDSVLRNGILAFLESSEGGTIADLRRFLLDVRFRERFLSTVTDPEIVYYWQKAFPQLSGNRSIGPVVTRLDEFLSPKPIRFMVSQKENRVNFAEVLDGGKILLAKLSQGQIGRENSYLLGSLLLSKIQQMAMSRQRMRASERRDFWCYVDEFHCFITPSMTEILTGARKYRVGLTLAHQELRQLQANAEVSSAVLANACARIAFRVGDADARALESGFSHFEARDLQNLEIGRAICRIERSDCDFNLFIPASEELDDERAQDIREQVIAASRERYSLSRTEVEAALRRSLDPEKDKTHAVPPAPSAPDQPPATASEAPPVTAKEPASLLVAAKEAEPPAEKSPPNAEDPKPVAPPPDLGRGGAQHQAIQQRLKAEAEGLGYRAIVEKPVLDGQGSVDLVLEKAGQSIACEISVTTTIDHEIGNIRKCLKADFPHVVVICPKAARLEQIRDAAKGCLAPDAASRVDFCSPEEFIACVETLSLEAAEKKVDAPPQEERRRGYKVKRSYVDLPPEEMKAREEAALKTLAETMRRKRKSKG
jgi:hypothetical protein